MFRSLSNSHLFSSSFETESLVVGKEVLGRWKTDEHSGDCVGVAALGWDREGK
jgi:hypothetical protein